MMWEVFNVVADAHGVNVARRRMSDYIVGGLLLAPRNATFTEQRDRAGQGDRDRACRASAADACSPAP
jgi:hypothetical protein